MCSKWILAVIVGACLFTCGCETAKGFKQDVKNGWHNAQGFDEWFKENLW